MQTDLDRLLERFKIVAEGGKVLRPPDRFTTYTISAFRGGIGKSILAFNLAREISRHKRSLLIDACPQGGFTQSLPGEDITNHTKSLYDALLFAVMAGTPKVKADNLLVSVRRAVFRSRTASAPLRHQDRMSFSCSQASFTRNSAPRRNWGLRAREP